jgi:hypothetical protein
MGRTILRLVCSFVAMRARTSLLCAVTLLSLMTPALPRSDADRATARALGDEGTRLQTAARFAEALERFQRSQTVIPSGTRRSSPASARAGTRETEPVRGM